MENKTVEISLSDLSFLLELVTRLQKSALTSSVENHVLNLVMQKISDSATQNNKIDGSKEIE